MHRSARASCLSLLPALILALLLAAGAGAVPPPAEAAGPDALQPYAPRLGRTRPLVVVIGENHYTELTDYVVPYGILKASGAADVLALGMQPGPVRMFPAPMQVLPQSSVAEFDAAHPLGADYVIVPAVHRDDDPALLDWVRSQAAKGAVVVGVCDGVHVLANAGLLAGRRATAHWFSIDGLRRRHAQTEWLRQRRYVQDGPVITTTGVTATIPVSLALVEAMAGRAAALQLARSLQGGAGGWSARHPSERFEPGLGHALTIAGNTMALWAHRDLGIRIDDGVDELALALQAEVWSATYRSTAYTVSARQGPVSTLRGLRIVPDRRSAEGLQMLPAPEAAHPLRALGQALEAVAATFGARTAAVVALRLEYASPD